MPIQTQTVYRATCDRMGCNGWTSNTTKSREEAQRILDKHLKSHPAKDPRETSFGDSRGYRGQPSFGSES